jgi:hypothetical protein
VGQPPWKRTWLPGMRCCTCFTEILCRYNLHFLLLHFLTLGNAKRYKMQRVNSLHFVTFDTAVFLKCLHFLTLPRNLSFDPVQVTSKYAPWRRLDIRLLPFDLIQVASRALIAGAVWCTCLDGPSGRGMVFACSHHSHIPSSRPKRCTMGGGWLKPVCPIHSPPTHTLI